MLNVTMFIACINYHFFLEEVPEELGGWDKVETLTIKPRNCYVKPVLWKDVKA
jgi:hypothetical protein